MCCWHVSYESLQQGLSGPSLNCVSKDGWPWGREKGKYIVHCQQEVFIFFWRKWCRVIQSLWCIKSQLCSKSFHLSEPPVLTCKLVHTINTSWVCHVDQWLIMGTQQVWPLSLFPPEQWGTGTNVQRLRVQLEERESQGLIQTISVQVPAPPFPSWITWGRSLIPLSLSSRVC